MKRGCLLRSAAYLIILAAILVYLFDKYGQPVYESSKQKITEVFLEQLEDGIKNAAPESLTDSLKNAFTSKVEEIKNSNQIPDSTRINELVGELKSYIENHSEDIGDISKLKEIIADYEQREKN